MKVAILSPHLDDAVLSCWHLLEGPGDVTIVNVFTASPPPGIEAPFWDRLTGATDPVARMAERREEDRRALRRASRESRNLGLLDAQYGARDLSTVALAAHLRGLLEPETVIAAPAGIGGHPDHKIVRDAALRLASQTQPVLLYADLPHAIARGWPGWVTGEPEPAGIDVGEEWSRLLANAGLTVSRLVPRVRPLGAAARERKLRALAEYRTQRGALDAMAFVALDDPRALAFEVSWSVPRSAVRRGAEEHVRELRVVDGGGDLLHDRR